MDAGVARGGLRLLKVDMCTVGIAWAMYRLVHSYQAAPVVHLSWSERDTGGLTSRLAASALSLRARPPAAPPVVAPPPCPRFSLWATPPVALTRAERNLPGALLLLPLGV